MTKRTSSSNKIDRVLWRAREQYQNVRTRWLQIQGAPTIHCIGDSHTELLRYIYIRGLLANTILKFCIVIGATATGFANPNSTTQARPVFEKYLKNTPPQHPILFCLGEVDCGFVIWYRSNKHGTPVREQFQYATATYANFLQVQSQRHPHVIVMSVPLPTVQDGQQWGEVANRRREVHATLAERTALTREFNRFLREFTNANHMLFLDLDTYTYNGTTGLVDPRFVNSNPLDHHLESSAVAPILVRLLNQSGFS